jgi:hypothetical protein
VHIQATGVGRGSVRTADGSLEGRGLADFELPGRRHPLLAALQGLVACGCGPAPAKVVPVEAPVLPAASPTVSVTEQLRGRPDGARVRGVRQHRTRVRGRLERPSTAASSPEQVGILWRLPGGLQPGAAPWRVLARAHLSTDPSEGGTMSSPVPTVRLVVRAVAVMVLLWPSGHDVAHCAQGWRGRRESG